MKAGQRLWTKQELIIVINLYCKTPFGKLHRFNPEVIALANLLKRTPSAVAYKLVNFASLDPSLKKRGIKGAVNVSSLDKDIWQEFFDHWDILPYESEKILAEFKNVTVAQLNNILETDLPKEGKTRDAIVKVRVNQCFFRSLVLSSYNNTCCITGIQQPELLIAGHIKAWSIDEKNRLNPRNGIAINNLHDKAFEKGLITITPEFKIKISSLLKKQKLKPVIQSFFLNYESKQIILPSRFLPDLTFLEHHNNEIFIQ